MQVIPAVNLALGSKLLHQSVAAVADAQHWHLLVHARGLDLGELPRTLLPLSLSPLGRPTTEYAGLHQQPCFVSGHDMERDRVPCFNSTGLQPN